jgi:hypothetical protein
VRLLTKATSISALSWKDGMRWSRHSIRLALGMISSTFRGKLDWHGDFDPFVEHLGLRTALPGT